MLSLKDVIALNEEFHSGKLANRGSLEFALHSAKRTRNWIKGLAYLTRAILIDHAFEDGNKRTAAALIMAVAYHEGFRIDKDALARLVVRVLRKNTTSVRELEEMIKDVVV